MHPQSLPLLLGSTLKLIDVVLPLGLDILGVALALDIAGLAARQRARIALSVAAFEAAMPLVGAALGAPLGYALGGAADERVPSDYASRSDEARQPRTTVPGRATPPTNPRQPSC